MMKNQSDTASKWREEAEYRRKNARWLRYSAMIALQVRDDFSLLEGVQTVGICGATSTPKWLMEDVKSLIEQHILKKDKLDKKEDEV